LLWRSHRNKSKNNSGKDSRRGGGGGSGSKNPQQCAHKENTGGREVHIGHPEKAWLQGVRRGSRAREKKLKEGGSKKGRKEGREREVFSSST